tara:strand:+ start:3272 stop:3577 length:306 start_codon:yes stop_codon:yes gene_type:complete
MYFLFIVISAVLFYQAFRLMSQGWTAMDTPKEQPNYKPHPEMEEVKSGDQLLVVNFNRQPQQPNDPLYQSLGNRLQNGPIDDPWEDEDDDNDGDVPAIVRR